MSVTIQNRSPVDNLYSANELSFFTSSETPIQSTMRASHSTDSLQACVEETDPNLRSSYSLQTAPNETLRILDSYNQATNDAEALDLLHSLDRQTFSLLKSDLYLRAQLNPIYKGDAAANFIEEKPRHEVVKSSVEHIIHRTLIQLRQNTSTPTISEEDSEGSIENGQEEYQASENIGFFSTICDSFCAWINDITNWIVKCCNGNEVEEDETEISLFDEVVALNQMINEQGIDAELVQVTFGLLFNKFPEFKASIHRLIIAAATEAGDNILSEENYANYYINTFPLGDHVRTAVRIYLEENQTVASEFQESEH